MPFSETKNVAPATLPGVPQTPLLAPTTLLLIAGTVLPSLLAAPRAIVGSQVAAARAGWLADSLCCAGVLAVTSGVAHCFSILDQPSLLAPGLAFVAASFAVPILAGTLVRLYGSPGDADASSTVATSSPHPAFVAVVMATLVGMVAFVGVVLQQGVAG